MADQDFEKEVCTLKGAESSDDLESTQKEKTEEEEYEYLRPGHQPSGQSRAPSTARSACSARSFVDGHGIYFTEQDSGDEQNPDGQEDLEVTSEKAFEVGWDGPDDPMNPKNMNTARKWLVVMTLALGSLCVTCTSSLYTTTYGMFFPTP